MNFWKRFLDASKFVLNNRGIIGGIVAALPAAFSLGKSIFSMFKKKPKGPSLGFDFQAPSFEEDPFVGKTQEQLFGTGKRFLEGDIPDFFKPIGEIGGSEFENLISQLETGVVSSVEESAAKRGFGFGGGVTPTIAREVSKTTAPLRFAEFQRALQGRAGFLSFGANVLSGVRSAGLTNQAQKNQFALSSSGLNLENLFGQADLDVKEIAIREALRAKKGAGISSLLKSGFGASGKLFGNLNATKGMDLNLLERLFGGAGKIGSATG